MSERIIRGMALERTGVTLMARILGHGGYPITKASLASMSYEVGYRPRPIESIAPHESADEFLPTKTKDATAIDIETTVFDTLQTSSNWIVTAASPANTNSTSLYVEPLAAPLPKGAVLNFPVGTVTLKVAAQKAQRQLSATIVGSVAAGDRAVAEFAQKPPFSPWKVDDAGYNFLLSLPASDLGPIPIETFPQPRYYVVSIKAVPVSGEVFGWEYEIETHHWLYGKWKDWQQSTT